MLHQRSTCRRPTRSAQHHRHCRASRAHLVQVDGIVAWIGLVAWIALQAALQGPLPLGLAAVSALRAPIIRIQTIQWLVVLSASASQYSLGSRLPSGPESSRHCRRAPRRRTSARTSALPFSGSQLPSAWHRYAAPLSPPDEASVPTTAAGLGRTISHRSPTSPRQLPTSSGSAAQPCQSGSSSRSGGSGPARRSCSSGGSAGGCSSRWRRCITLHRDWHVASTAALSYPVALLPGNGSRGTRSACTTEPARRRGHRRRCCWHCARRRRSLLPS